MPVKVAHVVRQYHPSIGGMEEVVHNIAAQQRARHDHLPKIITLNRLFRNASAALPSHEWMNGIEVQRLPYRGSSRYPLCPAVLDEVRDADIIHVHGIDFFYDFLAATRGIHRRPMVVSTHGGFFHTRFVSALKQIYFHTATRLSALAYDSVIATSDNDGEIFNAIVKSPKLAVIENGVNIDKFADQAALTLTPTLIYFGRWSENKGLLQTIDFFKSLTARSPGWRLIIAGREYDHTEASLRAYCRQQGLNRKVELVANPSEAELIGCIRRASYFICLSRHEGFGIAPIEAMSAGLTPILSDIPPFRSLLAQAGVGILQDQGLAQSVADLITMHQTGEAKYANRRVVARAFVERYNWKHIADKYIDVYEAALRGRARKLV